MKVTANKDNAGDLLHPLNLERDNVGYNRREFLVTAIGSFILLTVGFSMLCTGMVWVSTNHKGYTIFLILGAMLFLPGSYGSYHVIGILMGWRGFEYEAILSNPQSL